MLFVFLNSLLLYYIVPRYDLKAHGGHHIEAK